MRTLNSARGSHCKSTTNPSARVLGRTQNPANLLKVFTANLQITVKSKLHAFVTFRWRIENTHSCFINWINKPFKISFVSLLIFCLFYCIYMRDIRPEIEHCTRPFCDSNTESGMFFFRLWMENKRLSVFRVNFLTKLNLDFLTITRTKFCTNSMTACCGYSNNYNIWYQTQTKSDIMVSASSSTSKVLNTQSNSFFCLPKFTYYRDHRGKMSNFYQISSTLWLFC